MTLKVMLRKVRRGQDTMLGQIVSVNCMLRGVYSKETSVEFEEGLWDSAVNLRAGVG